MSLKNVNQQTADTLIRVMALGMSDNPTWTSQELAAILEYQLSAPLAQELSGLKMTDSDQTRSAIVRHDPEVETFRDLLTHPNPPLDSLTLVKEYAKAIHHHPDHPLPPPITMILYYAAIVTAKSRYEKYITTLSTQTVREGIEWILNLPWIDDAMRVLFREGLRNCHG